MPLLGGSVSGREKVRKFREKRHSFTRQLECVTLQRPQGPLAGNLERKIKRLAVFSPQLAEECAKCRFQRADLPERNRTRQLLESAQWNNVAIAGMWPSYSMTDRMGVVGVT